MCPNSDPHFEGQAEDFVKNSDKKEKDLAKPVDVEIEEFVKSNPRLFDKAFVSTNEEVQVGFNYYYYTILF